MTARRIRSDELIDLAATLAGEGQGRGRPRSIHLRRSVSSAYYAVFHEVIDQAIDELYGPGSTWEVQREAVSRWIAHGELRILASAVNVPVALSAALITPTSELQRVAEGIVELQDARHLADYDHTYDLDKRQALALLELARDVIHRSRRMRSRSDSSYTVFLRLMFGAVRIAKKR